MSDVKDVFISRFPGGYIYEVDFSQLEIFALAYLSQDQQLIADLVGKLDMHTIRAREIFNTEHPKPQQRTYAKRLSFQLQYGAGYASMAKKLGLPVEVCKKFIETYYDRYPGVESFQERMINAVKTHKACDFKGKVHNGQEQRAVRLQSVSGRFYTFIQQEAPDFIKKQGEYWSFKPTEIKNYFVQGFATADLVPLFAGQLLRRVTQTGLKRILLINTVHDSVLADVHPKEARSFELIVEGLMEHMRELIRKWLAEDFDLPIEATIERGFRWSEKQKITYHQPK